MARSPPSLPHHPLQQPLPKESLSRKLARCRRKLGQPLSRTRQLIPSASPSRQSSKCNRSHQSQHFQSPAPCLLRSLCLCLYLQRARMRDGRGRSTRRRRRKTRTRTSPSPRSTASTGMQSRRQGRHRGRSHRYCIQMPLSLPQQQLNLQAWLPRTHIVQNLLCRPTTLGRLLLYYMIHLHMEQCCNLR